MAPTEAPTGPSLIDDSESEGLCPCPCACLCPPSLGLPAPACCALSAARLALSRRATAGLLLANPPSECTLDAAVRSAAAGSLPASVVVGSVDSVKPLQTLTGRAGASRLAARTAAGDGSGGGDMGRDGGRSVLGGGKLGRGVRGDWVGLDLGGVGSDLRIELGWGEGG